MAQVIIPGRLGPGEVWELMPWPGCSVADDPGMMESLLHTDRVSVKDKVMFKISFMMQTYINNLNKFLFAVCKIS